MDFKDMSESLGKYIWHETQHNIAEKRRDNWTECLGEKLSQKELTFEEVLQNELFVSAMLKATDIATKTIDEKKREYLANAVIQTIGTWLDESLMMIYLNMLERYTMWHLRILMYFNIPKECLEDQNTESLTHMYESMFTVFPEFQRNSHMVHKIIQDFYGEGMLDCKLSSDGKLVLYTTAIATDFLAFITHT